MGAERKVWTVSEVNEALRDLVEGSLLPIWVAGEVGNLTLHRSGHVYMTLKDANSQMKAVFFGGAALCRQLAIAEGSKVEAFGKLSFYMARGECQLSVKSLRPLGLGDLQRSFEELKAKLAAEGLFDEARKRPMPPFPTRIGLVTSPDGAALKDFIRIAFDRMPGLQLKVYPAPVQGKGAERKLAAGVELFNRTKDVDVIVLTRGGGSLEDLWPFNEELLARAVAASEIPVVSAVGHEIDFTICDFAADLRAPTPSGAAEALVPVKEELEAAIESLSKRISAQAQLSLERLRSRFERLKASAALRQPAYMVMERRQRIDELCSDMETALRSSAERSQAKLEALEGRLKALSPYQVLRRGYALLSLQEDGRPLLSPEDAPAGTALLARLAGGELKLRSEGPASPGS